MIHKISIENFYSVADKQEMDFRVPANAPDLGCFRGSRAVPSQRLPLVIGIYGPNASGKSTILRAITTTAWFIRHSFALPSNGTMPFFNPYARQDWQNRHGVIVIEYDGQLAKDTPTVVFKYELHIRRSLLRIGRNEVYYESLSHAPHGKFRMLFERQQQQFSFGPEFGITKSDTRLQSIPPDASLVSTLAQLNHKSSSDYLQAMGSLQTNMALPDRSNGNSGRLRSALSRYVKNPDYLQRLNCELSRLDLGLEGMKIEQNEMGSEATLKHFGLDRSIEISEESSGTQRFIAIFPLLQYVLGNGGLAVIDELDADIHPLLIPELFRWFYDKERNPKGAQLLFTAHNPAILDQLEKEQVYFSEKPSGQPTRIYGAREIKGLRREPSLMKKYLSGELGAVPHIG